MPSMEAEKDVSFNHNVAESQSPIALFSVCMHHQSKWNPRKDLAQVLWMNTPNLLDLRFVTRGKYEYANKDIRSRNPQR